MCMCVCVCVCVCLCVCVCTCVCVCVCVCVHIHVYKSDELPICLQYECTLSICCSAGDNVLDILLAEPRAISGF